MAELNVDLSGVEVGSSDFVSIPAGNYAAEMVQADYLPTKSGDGKCLHLTFRITAGPHANRELRDFLTLEHSNETTVKIAQERLKKLAVAVGAPNPDLVKSTEDLTGPLQLVVTQKKDDEWGDADGLVNRITAFKKSGAGPGTVIDPPSVGQPAEDVPF